MVHLDVDAPASSWGLIIGKGGATLQKLQADYGVRVTIPRPNQPGSVVIHGSHADCQACAAQIQSIVTSNSRGKDRQKKTWPGGSDKKAAKVKISGSTKINGSTSAAPLAPLKCGLCGTADLSSTCVIFDHLGGSAHLCKVVEACPELLPVVARPDGQSSAPSPPARRKDASGANPLSKLGVLGVALALSDADFRKFHEDYGYDVEGLLDVAEGEHARRERAAQMQSAIDRLDDAQWMVVEDRQVVGWDSSCDDSPAATLPLRKAPQLDDMVARCLPGAKPPLVRVPANLPAALPRVDPKNRRVNNLKRRHIYPAEVSGMRLAIAASHCAAAPGPRAGSQRRLAAAAAPLAPGDFDFVCGTSFIKALAGDANVAKDEFFLQRVPLPGTRRRGGGTVCVLHIPSTSHNQDDTGHAVERLLCGATGPAGGYYAITAMRIPGIGQHAGQGTRLLVCSEVDASAEDGALVEIKSSKVHRGKALTSPKVALQCAVNGSQFALSCGLDKDGANLESVEWLPFSGIAADHAGALRKLGKHVRFCLDRVQAQLVVAEGDVEEEGAPPIFRLTFDGIKAPALERAAPGCGVEVVPAELL